MEFNAHHKWFGIPPDEQPPNHYRLLGIPLFESDREVIRNGADQRMSFLKTLGGGPHSAISQQLLNEVAAAKVCLLNPQKKRAYDERLRSKLDSVNRQAARIIAEGAVAAPAVAPAEGTPTVDIRPLEVSREKRQERTVALKLWLLRVFTLGMVGIVAFIIWNVWRRAQLGANLGKERISRNAQPGSDSLTIDETELQRLFRTSCHDYPRILGGRQPGHRP